MVDMRVFFLWKFCFCLGVSWIPFLSLKGFEIFGENGGIPVLGNVKNKMFGGLKVKCIIEGMGRG